MSRERALKAINFEDTDKIPQLDTLSHPEYMKKLTGKDSFASSWEGIAESYKMLDLDFVIYTEEGYVPQWESDTEQISTEWGGGSTEWRTKFRCQSMDEVLAYDPWSDQERRSVSEITDIFFKNWTSIQNLFGSTALVSGGLYRTLFMWPVLTFGWELFMMSAASEPKKFKTVIDRFAEISIRDTEAWAGTDIKIFASHDDLAMTSGLIFSPEWYRTYLFPWYKKIWKPLKEKGIKVIFISDGDISAIIDDLVEAGVDGFRVEPMVSLKWLANKYGRSKIIIGNIDTKVLTFKGPREIEKEVERCVREAGNSLGYFLNVSGGIPQNIPLHNVEAYFKACKNLRCRNKQSMR